MYSAYDDLKVNSEYKLSRYLAEAKQANLAKQAKTNKTKLSQKFGQFLIQLGTKMLTKPGVTSSKLS